MSESQQSTSNVEENKAANTGAMVYAVAISVGGLVLGVVTFLKGWGFMGYMGGALLMVAGISMLVARAKGGVKFVTVTCPSCSEKNTFGDDSFVDQGTRPCEHCGTYLWEDAGRVVAVPAGTVHPKPAFAAPLVLPLEIHDCVVCGAQADFKIQIEGTTKKIGVATNTYVTREVALPVCGAHQDNENAALVGGGIGAEGLDGFALRLRNFDLAERLRGR